MGCLLLEKNPLKTSSNDTGHPSVPGSREKPALLLGFGNSFMLVRHVKRASLRTTPLHTGYVGKRYVFHAKAAAEKPDGRSLEGKTGRIALRAP